MKAVLSLFYTGEVPFDLSDEHLLELLETVHEFELDIDLIRICQAMCTENITLFSCTTPHFCLALASSSYVCQHFVASA